MFGCRSPGLVHYVWILAALVPNGIQSGGKFTLRPSLAFSGVYNTAERSSSVRQPNCGVVGMELRNFRSSSFSTDGATYIPMAAITLGKCPHPGFYVRPME